MDIEDLVSKVQLNPAIWDKRITEHSNWNVVDACWKKISLEMKIDEGVLRKKWKYLRDQFSVECSKVKPVRSGDAAGTANEPKWPFFKPMFFLKDIVKPRASSSNLKPKLTLVTAVTDDVEPEEEVDESRRDEPDSVDLVIENEVLNVNVPDTLPIELSMPDNPPATQSKKRRRVATNTLYNDRILQLEQQKINTIQNAFQRDPDNDDLLFFKSLLPFVSKIPTEKKLRFRSRIQEVVEEFAYTIPLQQLSPGSSRSTLQPSPALSTASSYDSRPPSVGQYHKNYGNQIDIQSFAENDELSKFTLLI